MDAPHMTRRDLEVIANLIVRIVTAVEQAKQAGPSFKFEQAIDDAVEEAASQLDL